MAELTIEIPDEYAAVLANNGLDGSALEDISLTYGVREAMAWKVNGLCEKLHNWCESTSLGDDQSEVDAAAMAKEISAITGAIAEMDELHRGQKAERRLA